LPFFPEAVASKDGTLQPAWWDELYEKKPIK
jgi:hypothetical protein